MNSLQFTLLHFMVYLYKICNAKEYKTDFVVVGAGAAGSAVASRLSEDGKHRVLLLEAGGKPEHFNDIPYFAQGPFNGELDWALRLEPNDTSCSPSKSSGCVFHQGKGEGGSTLINVMIYARGNAKDYDHWKDLGNPGWGFRDVLPFYKKLENYRVNVSENDQQYHGVGGPVDITPSPYYPELTDPFLEAGREIGYGTVDYNGEKQKGFSRMYFTIRNGLRYSAYKAYLKKAKKRKNLRVINRALVLKVEFDSNKRATGVVFERDGKQQRVRAKKEVIITAGAIASPKLLQLSGIGPKKLLDKYNIPVVHELRGVGENLQNQIYVSGLAVLLKENIGFDYSKDVNAENFELLETRGQGPLTVPMQMSAISFVDSDYADKNIDWPDLEILAIQPPKKLRFPCTSPLNFFSNYFGLIPVIMRPYSRGSVRINSSNPRDQSDIQFNFLSDNRDVKVLASAVKICQRLASTEALKKHGAFLPPLPVIAPCENLDASSDEYLECFVRNSYDHSHHVTGTCKMGVQNDSEAVVDANLKVYGVKNFRVVDNSVAPTVITGHTMAVSYMIGEKGADLILRDWKKKSWSLFGN